MTFNNADYSKLELSRCQSSVQSYNKPDMKNSVVGLLIYVNPCNVGCTIMKFFTRFILQDSGEMSWLIINKNSIFSRHQAF